MLSTLLLQVPASDVLETSSPSLEPVSQQPSGALPEAFTAALYAAVAKLNPRPDAQSADTLASAEAMDLEAETTPADTPADPLALLHTEQVRYQLDDIAWALPAVANPTVTTTTTASADPSVAGSQLPPQLPANGSALPVDRPIQALPPKLDSSAALSASIDVLATERLGESNLPATRLAAIPTTPSLSSSLTIQPATPMPAQPGELSLALPQADTQALPAQGAEERIERAAQTRPANSESEMVKPSMGSARPELSLSDPASTAAAAQIHVPLLAKRDTSAKQQLPPAPAPVQMIAAGNAALEKVPAPVFSASERASVREPQTVHGSIVEATNVAIQQVGAQGSPSASASGAAATVVLPATTSLVQTDGLLVAAQNPTANGPIETSAASLSVLEKPTEGAATQLRVLTLTQTDELGDKLGALLASIKHIGKSQLSIQLNPQELGRLEVRIAPGTEQALNVSITAQHSATRDLVEAHLHRLRSALDDQGYAEVHVEVGQDRDNATGHRQQAAEQQPTWPQASATGKPWGGSLSDTEPGVGLEHSQIAALGPGIDAYA